MLADEIKASQQSLKQILLAIKDEPDFSEEDSDFYASLPANHAKLANKFDKQYQNYLEDIESITGEEIAPGDTKSLNNFTHYTLFNLHVNKTISLTRMYAALLAIPNDKETDLVNNLCEQFPAYSRTDEFLNDIKSVASAHLEDVKDGVFAFDEEALKDPKDPIVISSDVDDDDDIWMVIQYCEILLNQPSHPEHDDFKIYYDFLAPEMVREAFHALRMEAEFIAGYLFQNDDFEGNMDLVGTLEMNSGYMNVINNFIETIFAETAEETSEETFDIIAQKYGALRPH